MVNSLYHMGTGNYHLLLPANQIWRADILVLWRPHLEEMFVISIHILLVRACLPTYNKQWVKPSGKNWNCYWQHFFIMWVFVSASWLTNVPSNQQPNLMSLHLDFFVCEYMHACVVNECMYLCVSDHGCMWIRRPEINISCLPQLLSSLFFEVGSLTELKAHLFV